MTAFQPTFPTLAQTLWPTAGESRWLRGVVLEQGAPTSHVAIVARALQIPMIGRCEGIATQAGEGEPIIVRFLMERAKIYYLDFA